MIGAAASGVLEVGMRRGKPGFRTEPAAARFGHFG